jgi:hypothetical protein
MRGITYPSHYPENCPKEPHTDLTGYYHRMVFKPDTLRKRDFRSQYERHKRDNPNSYDTCEGRAVSLFKDIEDAENVLHQHPGMNYRYIAKIYLPGNHGVIHHTPNGDGDSHHDWWIPNGVDPTSYDYQTLCP